MVLSAAAVTHLDVQEEHPPLECLNIAANWAQFVLQCTSYVTQKVNTMGEATFTFRVDAGLKDEFSTAAKSRDRTGAQLLRDFMRDFVKQQQDAAEHDAWFRRQVQVGLDSANAGRLVAAEDVEAEFTTRRTETRRKLQARS